MKTRIHPKLIPVIIFVAAAVLLNSCAPLKSPNSDDSSNSTAYGGNFTTPEVDEVLEPTYTPPSESESEKYEKPAETIQIQNKTVFLGRTKVSHVEMNFNRVTQKMHVTGRVSIFNEKKEELSQQEFNLEGLLADGEEKLILRPTTPLTQTEDDQLTPIVRAQALCLAQDTAKNRFDCSQSIIDLFISYKGQIFSEQLEVAKKTKSDTPVRSNDKRNSEITEKDEETRNESGELQSEGHEDSLPGRYEVSTKSANLDEIFNKTSVSTSTDTTKSSKKENPKDVPKEAAKAAEKPVTQQQEKAKQQTPAAPTTTPPTAAPDTAAPTPMPAPVTTDKKGEIKFFNQSIGFPDSGRLANPTSLLITEESLGQKANFEVVFPARDRYYGTEEINDLIVQLSERLSLTSKNKLFVSDISKKQGGHLGSHASHQSGVDADLGYPTDQSGVKFPIVVKGGSKSFEPKSYSVAATYDLLKYAFYQKENPVARVFVDQKIKNDLCGYAKSKKELTGANADLVKKMFESIQHVSGHGDHFHVRVKCSDTQPACRERVYRKVPGCA